MKQKNFSKNDQLERKPFNDILAEITRSDNDAEDSEGCLINTWESILRLCSALFVSEYFRVDYDEPKLDRQVYKSLSFPSLGSNQLLDLCQSLRIFYSLNESACLIPKEFFNINFDDYKLWLNPDLDNQNSKILQHVDKNIQRLCAEIEFLKKYSLVVQWDDTLEKGDSDYGASEETKENLITRGRCFLELKSESYLPLEPLLIGLRSNENDSRIMVLRSFSQIKRPLLQYEEVSSGRKKFWTDDPYLIRLTYAKQGLVCETPHFDNSFILNNGMVKVLFYMGSIFDLSSMADGMNAAIVVSRGANADTKSPICKQFELLSGIDVAKELEGRFPLSLGKVYLTKSGSFNFKIVFHVPVFNIIKNCRQSFEFVKLAIDNLLDKFYADNSCIDTLVVPAIGGDFGGQLNDQVARYWAESLDKRNEKEFKQVIFAFINSESVEAYKSKFEEISSKTNLEKQYQSLKEQLIEKEAQAEKLKEELTKVEKTIGEYHIKNSKFSDYPSPLAEKYNFLNDASRYKEKFETSFILIKMFYSLITAYSIRALYRETTQHGDGKLIYKNKIDFVKSLKNMWTKPFCNEGSWRYLAKDGINAIGETNWGVKDFFGGKKELKLFLETLGQDEWDLTNKRNDWAHQRISPDMPDAGYKQYASEANRKIEEILKRSSFLKSSFLELVWIEGEEYYEDATRIDIQYRSLTGTSFAPPLKHIKGPTTYFKGKLLVQKDRVYFLRRVDEDERVDMLYMHPFVLYGCCPGCSHDRIFIWTNFGTDEHGKKYIQYTSIGCHCKVDMTSYLRIVGNDERSIDDIMEPVFKLLPDEEEIEP
ncbi:MAG: macro domain-containing protein [Deltaproteobacteria bacterium]|nr:macro domain-containing protein [Deltaproteobacteria bacterium]